MSVSFRDPAGKLFLFEDQFFRVINKSGKVDFQMALSLPFLQRFADEGKVVKTFEINAPEKSILLEKLDNKPEFSREDVSLLVKHERIPFRSYPYEWVPEMLYSAADLTLELAENLLKEGMGLKDATPYNILFCGTNPVFVDWLSFEQRDTFDPIWLSQSQFIRTFYLPLMANNYFGLHLSWIFRVHRDGLEPEQVYQMSKFRHKFSLPFLSLVAIPKWLNSKSQYSPSIYRKHNFDDAEKAKFVLTRQFKSFKKLLKRIEPNTDKPSEWTDYMGDKQHFTDAYFQQKESFVKSSLAKMKPKWVLDVGCNTGHFSRLAAQNGAGVISIDQDPAVVSKVWRMAKQENLNILPLVVDISRPSPAIGWNNEECPSFLERVRGRIDTVMLLAVIHHLLVSERIPLEKIIRLTAEITKDTAIIEFVPPDDPMFRQIARGRDHLFEDLNSEVFQEVCLKYFKILHNEKLADSNREIYLLQK